MVERAVQGDGVPPDPVLLGVPSGNEVFVWCPYCRRFHIHGLPESQREKERLTHRTAHCFFQAGEAYLGYWILVLRPSDLDTSKWSRGNRPPGVTRLLKKFGLHPKEL